MADSLSLEALSGILTELIDGAKPRAAFVLNGGDPGLLASLNKLTAAEASAIPADGTSSIAAHVDHLCYGLGLMNRWASGENPFADADWTLSWQRTKVSDSEWTTLRQRLTREAERWREALRTPREMQPIEQSGVLGSVAHLAYHFGAIRQMNRRIRGPLANETVEAGLEPLPTS